MRPYDKFEIGDYILYESRYLHGVYILKIINKNKINQYKFKIIKTIGKLQWMWGDRWIGLNFKNEICKKLSYEEVMVELL